MNKIGSSETTRAACLNMHNLFSTINTKVSKKNLNYKIHFSYWLAGLIDCDVYLGVSKKNYTSCEITVGEKQLNLLTIVKKRLGGKITTRKNVKAYRWRLHNKKGMETLVHTINGKLLLDSKKIQLQKLCKVLNIKYKYETLFSIDNYWLAGFYEAEGYFHINSYNLQCNITCGQKTPDLLEKMQFFLGGNVYYDKSSQGYLYTASSIESLHNWFTYFNKFPLKSCQNIDLVRFKRILLFKQRKYHLSTTENGKYKIRFFKLLEFFKSRSVESSFISKKI